MKLAFLGTPEVAVPPLRALVADGHDVRLVVTRADKRRGRGGALMPSPVKAAAQELGLPVTDQIDEVMDAGAELGVVVAFGRLIKPHVLAALPMVNVHFSLLPRWRGAAPLERAILAGDAETGVCLMELEEGLDTGPVYDCSRLAIGAEETASELRARLVDAGTELLVTSLRQGLGTPTAQQGEPTYADKIDPARALALDALLRIDEEGAYANLVLPPMLQRSKLSGRDRGFVTELVYGTVRMRRACDWLVDRFVTRPLDPRTRNLLRMGAYQLHYLGTPVYAVVSTSVELGGRARRLVEAVLHRVAASDPEWPDDATRLSYPDWIVNRLVDDLGPADAKAALEVMNRAPTVQRRPDGYVQDPASQWTAAYVGAQAGEKVADLCAGPGGKATAIGEEGAYVAAGDVRLNRAALVRDNAR